MQKKFLSGLALMLLLNLLIKPLAIFGIDAQVQNQVGAEDYGMYFSLLNFSFLFNIFMDFGINNFTMKRVAQAPDATVSYLGRMVLFRFVLFIFYAIITFSAAITLGWGSEHMYLLAFLVLNQFFVTLIAYARSHFGGLLLFKTDAFLSVLDRSLLILFCGALLYLPLVEGSFKIEWFIYTQSACYGLTCLIAMVLLFAKIGLPKIAYRPKFNIAIVRKSFPYALLILLMMIYTRVDSVMIERLHEDGSYEAGYYAQGFRLLDAFFMFAMIFSNLLFPTFSRMLGKGERVNEILSIAGKLLLGGAITIAIVVFFHSEQVLSWIYKQDIYESSSAFRMLMIAFVGMCVSLLFSTLLTANGSMKVLNLISLSGILINIGVNAFLIPKYGANGAAFATMITQTVVALAQVIYCLIQFELRPSLLLHLKFVVFIASLVLLEIYVPIDYQFKIWVTLGLAAILMFTLRFIELKALMKSFSQNAE